MSKNCKHICKLCEYVIEENMPLVGKQYTCDANKREETDCVTGEKRLIYPFCSEINKDGCCQKFKRNVELSKRLNLVKALKRRQTDLKKEKSYYYHSETVEEMLLRNLIEILESGYEETKDFYREHTNYAYYNIYSTKYKKKNKDEKDDD